jgi:hypothetical protein
MTARLQDRLVSAILDADRALANQLIDDWTAEKGYDKAVIEVISPVLDEIGNMYAEAGEFSLSQAYVAAKVAEDRLGGMTELLPLAVPLYPIIYNRRFVL